MDRHFLLSGQIAVLLKGVRVILTIIYSLWKILIETRGKRGHAQKTRKGNSGSGCVIPKFF